MANAFASACLATLVVAAAPLEAGADTAGFVLLSPDVQPGRPFAPTSVADNYGCTGGNRSPALEWRDVPPGTKSFVITMFDPDEHGSPSGWWHWVLYDLPADTRSLPANAGAKKKGATLPPGTLEGRNDEGAQAYAGPCPDSGDPPHHYVLTIYALSVAKLPVPRGASGANVSYTARDYTIGVARIVALHTRS